MVECDSSASDSEKQYISDIRTALSQKRSRSKKMQVLTTLPQNWSINIIRQESEVGMIQINIVIK